MSSKPAINQPDGKSDSRDLLLHAAEKLFTLKSYREVSTREIADAAGVNLGAIQYHFGSKQALFIAVVQQMMQGSGCGSTRIILPTEIASETEAAAAICHFIREFLSFLLKKEGPQPCRLMFREILGAEAAQESEIFNALVTAFVEEFSRPMHTALVRVLKALRPEDSEKQLAKAAYSILGQCSCYVTHGPFIAKLEETSLTDTIWFEDTLAHLCTFSLRGLGCSEAIVTTALANARERSTA
jgi:AcrR family transcriptional regulator